MHTLQSARDFSNAPSQSTSPLPCKSKISSEQPKVEEKVTEKARPPSASSTAPVKPPYSYIALSNYRSKALQVHFIIFIHFTVTMSILQSPQKKLTLSGICEFIMSR